MATLASIRSPGVYIQEMPAGSRPIQGVGTAVAAFVGVTEKGPFNKAVRVTNWGQYVRTFGEYVDGAYLPHSVYQFFDNGGGACYVSRIGQGAPGEAQYAGGVLNSATQAGAAAYRVEAREPGIDGDGITVRVEPAQTAAEAAGGDTGDAAGDGEAAGDSAQGGQGQRPRAGEGEATYSVVIRRGETEERFDGLTGRKGRDLVAALEQSALVRAREVGNLPVADRIPAATTVVLAGGASLPTRLTVEDYRGDETARSGIAGLAAVSDVTMVLTPDLMAAYETGQLDADGVRAVQSDVIAHCEDMKDRMAILDTPKGLNAQSVLDWVTEKASFSSAYAVVQWPWVSFYDVQAKRARFMPPSGAVAGIWSRNDDTRGVHKAPANEGVVGALALEVEVTRREHDSLNPIGLNVLRSFPNRGAVLWGARTLSSDATWRYVNVRRTHNYVNASIENGTQWVVFEPNDLDLWQRIKRTVSAFLLGMWRDGALFGGTPDEAFYVKCDTETNPPEVRDAGYVVIEIGIAVVRPAEFVVFRISQYQAPT